MQLILRPITDHYCDGIFPKSPPCQDFAIVNHVLRASKCRELRCLLFSFAT